MKKMFLVLALVGMANALFANDAPPIRWSVGAGLDLMGYSNDQQLSNGYAQAESIESGSSWGYSAFVDATYVTLKLGIRNALGDYTGVYSGYKSGNGTFTWKSTISQLDFAVELKYPFTFGEDLSVAPKIGIESTSYLGGTINGITPTGDARQILSPIYITLGADLNYYFTPNVFIRPNLALGFSTNAKLSSAYYGGYFKSASEVAFIGGMNLGYTF